MLYSTLGKTANNDILKGEPYYENHPCERLR